MDHMDHMNQHYRSIIELISCLPNSPSLAGLHKGMLRWHIHYNLLLLRMLSFASDLHLARIALPEVAMKPDRTIDASKARVIQHLPDHMYSFLNFLAYCLYPPLYIAGPIVTFNSFTAQLMSPFRSIRPRYILTYTLRWGAALMSLEVLTHTIYYNCIAKLKAWPHLIQAGVLLGPLHYAEGGFWVLVFMWLKVRRSLGPTSASIRLNLHLNKDTNFSYF